MKAPLEQGFLSNPNKKTLPIRLLDVALLLCYMHQGNKHPRVGFEDTQNTVDMVTKRLNSWSYMPKELIESLLWSANLLDEEGAFWHPHDMTFEQWVNKLNIGRFNRRYNTLSKRKKTNA